MRNATARTRPHEAPRHARPAIRPPVRRPARHRAGHDRAGGRAGGRNHRPGAGGRRRGAAGPHRPLRPLDPCRHRCAAGRRGGGGRGESALPAGAAGGAGRGGGADRALPRRADAAGHGAARGRADAGHALERGGRGRPLCPRRQGGLSLLGADERPARARCGGGARGDDRADPGWRDPASGAGCRRPCRRDRGLAHRRRAGHRRPGLGHRLDPAGGQDRRPRQRLCGGGQAPGLRAGGHRFHRRALGGRGAGRCGAGPAAGGHRPAGPGRA